MTQSIVFLDWLILDASEDIIASFSPTSFPVQTCNVSSTPPYNNSQQVGAVSVLEYRQRVYYTCERGYYYTGTDTSILMQECLDDGNLSMPTGQCEGKQNRVVVILQVSMWYTASTLYEI